MENVSYSGTAETPATEILPPGMTNIADRIREMWK
jgi:hypothetical protein